MNINKGNDERVRKRQKVKNIGIRASGVGKEREKIGQVREKETEKCSKVR